MLQVIETPEFIACAKNIWGEDELFALIDHLAQNPQAGDLVPGSGGLRKLRWSAKGQGKRGGARVIYFLRNTHGQLVLITAYTKGRIENIPAHLLRALARKYDA
ncbi:MAG: transcriptional regulator [Comamonadaceae bacterium]|nr:transcriptional regulator [Comamonadaceae bacterium]